jgi:hypothetical protein
MFETERGEPPKGPYLMGMASLYATPMSRSRVFKKTIFSSEQLKNLEPQILPLLLELKTKWKQNKLTDYEMAFEYLKVFCEKGLGKILWRGLPLAIKETMRHWQKGDWKLVLTEKIPTVKQMLEMQLQQCRYVSMLFDFEFNHEGRDLFSFFLHDLMHAHHFFNHPEKMKGELGFYYLMKQALKLELLNEALQDPVFHTEFEYLISDMNAYCIHQLKYLRGALDRWEDRSHLNLKLYQKLFEGWRTEGDVKAAALKINTPDFKLEDELLLKVYFECQLKKEYSL